MPDGQRRLSTMAIVLGFIVDLAGSFGFAVVLSVVLGITVAIQSPAMSVDQLTERLTAMMYSRNTLILSLWVGLLFTMLGGAVAAYVAKFKELTHALVVGILSEVAAIISVLLTTPRPPVWWMAASFLLTIPVALLGGYLRVAYAKPQ